MKDLKEKTKEAIVRAVRIPYRAIFDRKEAKIGMWVYNKPINSVNEVDEHIWKIKTIKQENEVNCILDRVIIADTLIELDKLIKGEKYEY